VTTGYQALLQRLFAARRSGVELSLDRIERVLERLGHPEQRLGVRVLVGGTNGKGSTAAFTAAIATAAGYRTGLYTSPHLSRFAERFRVGGAEIDDDTLVAAADAVAGAGGAELTFFEQVTAMAVWAFARLGVEVGVFEVGLGGRLDATNALDPHAAAITGVALDHEDWLGPGLERIATEKAGIARAGRPLVIGAAGEPEGLALLVERARVIGAEARVIGAADLAAVQGLALGLPGAHQRANAACALALVEAAGLVAGEQARRRGLARAELPGRFETVALTPRVLVDGAHNPHAARTLAGVIAGLPVGRLVLVVGVSADKDVAGVLAPLLPLAAALVATRSRNPRAIAPAEIAAVARTLRPGLDARVCPDLPSALAAARALAGPDDTLLCAGSLFLVGEVRELCLGITPDPLAISDPLEHRGG
jgi:dihydrofolate synthase / folylpolyglutamate synthase